MKRITFDDHDLKCILWRHMDSDFVNYEEAMCIQTIDETTCHLYFVSEFRISTLFPVIEQVVLDDRVQMAHALKDFFM